MILGSSGSLRLPSKTELYTNIRDTTVSVDASWLDASSAGGGVACQGGTPASARFVAHAGGAFVAGGVVDADGSVAARVTIEPVDATAPAGETGGHDVPGDGPSGPGTDPAAGEPAADPSMNCLGQSDCC